MGQSQAFGVFRGYSTDTTVSLLANLANCVVILKYYCGWEGRLGCPMNKGLEVQIPLHHRVVGQETWPCMAAAPIWCLSLWVHRWVRGLCEALVAENCARKALYQQSLFTKCLHSGGRSRFVGGLGRWRHAASEIGTSTHAYSEVWKGTESLSGRSQKSCESVKY